MRSLRLVCLLLLALALGACESLPSRGGAGRLEAVLERGEFRVGLTGSQPPLNMKTRSGEIIGLEVDLVRALAESMGLRVRLVELPFARLLDALESGEVDLVASGMTITPERNARVAFAGPYFISGKSLLTRSEKISSAESSADLDVAGRSYAALAGSTSEKFVKEVTPRVTLVTAPDYDAAIQMVIEGKVDALVADFPICEVAKLRHADAGLTTLVTPFTVEPLGIALPGGDPLFVNLVQNYLATLDDTGMLTQLNARWFSYGSWVAELP